LEFTTPNFLKELEVWKEKSKVGCEVGLSEGLTVMPLRVGTEVVGYLEGDEEGMDVGRLEVGRTVG
jgi:hypothetical protein